MKSFFSLCAFLILTAFLNPGFAQLRTIPQPVKDSFASRYPGADSVKFIDNVVNVHAIFMSKGAHYDVTFNNKGQWKQTEKDWDFDKLNPEIVDGFQKSKYADWKVKETTVVYLPGGAEEYRIKIARTDFSKKYLFFNKNGRLLRETLAF
ncbi:MAG TPA: PepSY-like domain-containing protein [Flavisolibacter sp.]|nr:PepSY-like domain-containing protein [Flavisolibacter sp.]